MFTTLGEMAALGTALAFSLNSLCYEIAGKRISSYTVTHVRLWIAMAAMLVVHLMFNGSVYPENVTASEFMWLFTSGVIGYAIGDLGLFKALVLIGARLSMLVMTLVPIFASLIAWLMLGETLQPIEIGAIVLTMSSIGLVIANEKKSGGAMQHVSYKGIGFASIGALCQAIGMVFAKSGMQHGINAVSANSLRITGGLTAMFLITIFSGRIKSEVRNLKDRKGVKFLLIGSILGPVCGVILSLYAVSHAPVGIATTLMAMSPVMILPFAHFGMKEKLSKMTIAGTVLAVTGAIVLMLI